MTNIERNRMNFDVATRTYRDNELREQWLKQSDSNAALLQAKLQSKKSPKETEQKQLAQTQAMNKTNSIQQIEAVQTIDAINNNDKVQGVTPNIALSKKFDFSTATHFDIQKDIIDFVKPKAISQDYLTKNAMTKTSKNILAHLEFVGVNENLLKRATLLLQEEQNVKSVTDAYRNALIFA